MIERIETVVIGGGQAGLATSFELTRRGLEHVVLERGRIGEVWRSERWDGFYLNTPNWTLQLPGGEYDGDEPDAFLPRDEIVAYLEGYADRIDSPVREGVGVSRLARTAARWRLETSAGEIEADDVIVATGAFQKPARSPLADTLPADLLQLHTSEYRRPEQMEGAVLVVGSGQSGCQIAEELLTAGRRVYLCVGRCPWFPRRIRDHDAIHWALAVGLMDDTADVLPSPAARLACNPTVSGNDGGHDCNPRTLARDGATVVGRLEGCEHGKLVLGSGLAECLAAGDEFVAMLVQRVEEHVQANELDTPPHEAEPPPPIPEPPRELDLRGEGIGTVLWANGFRPDFSWIEPAVVDDMGWPLQRRGVAELPGLYFVGLHWLHKRKSALLFGVREDAEHVASVVDERAPG